MTREEVNHLHNPFMKNGRFNTDLQIDCTTHTPDPSLLKNTAVALVFPSQEWVDFASSISTITALFLDRPKAKDLSSIAKLPLLNLTISYPTRIKDWTFLSHIQSLQRVSLHNTLSLTDLKPVSYLNDLVVFQLSGGYSSTLRLPSLIPLGQCRQLVAIDLAAVRCSDPSLQALKSLGALRRFDAPLWWPKNEVQALLSHNEAIQSNITDT